MTLSNPGVDVRRLAEVGDERVDRQLAVERHAEQRKVVEDLGEAEEPSSRAEEDLLSAGMDGLVSEIHASLSSTQDEDLLARELGAGLVLCRVDDLLGRVGGDVLSAKRATVVSVQIGKVDTKLAILT